MTNRCSWCGDDPLYVNYHDKEWGVPVYEDTKLFECLSLEGAQAGLSWITVLRKREGYREAFDFFDYEKIANYSDRKINKLMNNEGIVRNRLKIMSVRQNAISFLLIRKKWGRFSNYIWEYVGNEPVVDSGAICLDTPFATNLSVKISKDLKKMGFKFVGPTIIYAFMQAVGMVNDHSPDCFRFKECQKLRTDPI